MTLANQCCLEKCTLALRGVIMQTKQINISTSRPFILFSYCLKLYLN